MDPLSITAGVASLLKLTGSIAWELKKFHDDAKEVDKHLKTVLRDVERFNVVLHSMRDTFSNITAQSTTGFAGALWKNVAQSLEDGVGVLQEFDGKLKIINKDTKFLNSARKQIRLNFADGDIAAFRGQITSFRDCLSLSMSTIILHNQFFNPAAREPKQPTVDLEQLETEIRRTANETNQKIQALQDLLSIQPTSLAPTPGTSLASATDADGARNLMTKSILQATLRNERYVHRPALNQSAKVSSSSKTTNPSATSASYGFQTPTTSGSQASTALSLATSADAGSNALPHVQQGQLHPELKSEDSDGRMPSHAGSSPSNAQLNGTVEVLEESGPLASAETDTAVLQSRVVVLTNLRNCVQASAEIVSNASSVAASEQVRDNMSVIAGSDFGDCFPPVRNLAMKRWLDSATVIEEDEVAGVQSASDSGSESSGASGGEYDLETDITVALLGAAAEKSEGDDRSAAERMFKDVLDRTNGDRQEQIYRRKQRLALKAMWREAANKLFKLYFGQARWSECKTLWLSVMEEKQQSAQGTSGPQAADLLVLAELLVHMDQMVESRLYARQALQISRRVRDGTCEVNSLQILLSTHQPADPEHTAYTYMLRKLGVPSSPDPDQAYVQMSVRPDLEVKSAQRYDLPDIEEEKAQISDLPVSRTSDDRAVFVPRTPHDIMRARREREAKREEKTRLEEERRQAATMEAQSRNALQRDALFQAIDRVTPSTMRHAAADEGLSGRSIRDGSKDEMRLDSRSVSGIHQAGLADLLNTKKISFSSDQEEILNDILSSHILDGVDVDNLTAKQEEDLTGRIADLYRQRQRSRRLSNSDIVHQSRSPSRVASGARDTLVVDQRDAVLVDVSKERNTHFRDFSSAFEPLSAFRDGTRYAGGRAEASELPSRRTNIRDTNTAHSEPAAGHALLSHAEMARRLEARPSEEPASINRIWMTGEHNRHMMHTEDANRNAYARRNPAPDLMSSWGPVDTQKRLQELSPISPQLQPENAVTASTEPAEYLKEAAPTRKSNQNPNARSAAPLTGLFYPLMGQYDTVTHSADSAIDQAVGKARKAPLKAMDNSSEQPDKSPQWLDCPVKHCTSGDLDVESLYRHVQTAHQPGFEGTLRAPILRDFSMSVAPHDSLYSKYLVCPADSHPGDTFRRHIAFVGCTGTGKTALISAWRQGSASTAKATLIRDDIVKFETRNHQQMTVTLTEIGGGYNYETGIASRPMPDLVVICYDIAAPMRCRYQYTKAMSEQLKNAPFILVACKGDLESIADHPEPFSKDDEAYYGYVNDLSVASFVTSARQHKGLKELFDFILSFVVVNDINYNSLHESYELRRQRIVAQRMKGGSLADLHPEPRYNEVVTATYDFEAATYDELSFTRGEKIHVLESKYKDWWLGRIDDRTGIFPTNYITRAM